MSTDRPLGLDKPALQSFLFSPLTVTPSTPLKQVIQLMAQSRAVSPLVGAPKHEWSNQGHSSCVVVVDAGKPIGIFTEGDLVQWVADRTPLEQVAIAALMQPVTSLKQSQFCYQYCALIFSQQQIRELLIVDAEEHLLGVLTQDGMWQFLQSAGASNFQAFNLKPVTEEEDQLQQETLSKPDVNQRWQDNRLQHSQPPILESCQAFISNPVNCP